MQSGGREKRIAFLKRTLNGEGDKGEGQTMLEDSMDYNLE